jgi:hypothetical protein
LRVAIVGPREKSWVKYGHEKRLKAIEKIHEILFGHLYREGRRIFIEKAGNISLPPVNVHLRGLKTTTFVSGGCPEGGVDVWAEITALMLNIPMDIKHPEMLQWGDITVEGVKYIGYKSRNVMIAEDCDVLYLINPEKGRWGGGMWTYNYANKLGKEVHEVVIE